MSEHVALEELLGRRVAPAVIGGRAEHQGGLVLALLVQVRIRIVVAGDVAGDRPAVDLAGRGVDEPLVILGAELDELVRIDEVGADGRSGLATYCDGVQTAAREKTASKPSIAGSSSLIVVSSSMYFWWRLGGRCQHVGRSCEK